VDDSALVESIARQRELVDRVLAEHVDDGTGLCKACPRGGLAGWQRWPCRLHSLATFAHEALTGVPGGYRIGGTR